MEFNLFILNGMVININYFQVHSIREAAATNLTRLVVTYGAEWAMQHIIPQVLFYLHDKLIICLLTFVAYIFFTVCIHCFDVKYFFSFSSRCWIKLETHITCIG